MECSRQYQVKLPHSRISVYLRMLPRHIRRILGDLTVAAVRGADPPEIWTIGAIAPPCASAHDAIESRFQRQLRPGSSITRQMMVQIAAH